MIFRCMYDLGMCDANDSYTYYILYIVLIQCFEMIVGLRLNLPSLSMQQLIKIKLTHYNN